jgi:hypothetical protein
MFGIITAYAKYLHKRSCFWLNTEGCKLLGDDIPLIYGLTKELVILQKNGVGELK